MSAAIRLSTATTGTIIIPANATRTTAPKAAGVRARSVIIAPGAASILDVKEGRSRALPGFGGIFQRRAQDDAAIDRAGFKLDRVALPVLVRPSPASVPRSSTGGSG